MPVEDIVGCVALSAPVDAVVFPRILAMVGAALDVAAAIRPPSLQGMAVAIPGISLRWAIWARREDKECSAPAARRVEGGSAIHWSTGRQPTTWTTGAVREACAGSTWTRIGRSRHARLAQRLATGGGLSGNVETRRRADSKKLEMADLKKAAAPLATHMRRLRGVRPEDEAPHVPESVGAEVLNDSRLQRQTRLQHRHRLAELLAAVWVRPSISQTSAGKRMAASHRWRRRKSAPAKDTPLSSSPRGTGNGTENGRGKGSVITVHPAHLPVGLGVKTKLSPLIPR